MTCSLEYHKNVRRWILASVSVLALLLSPALPVSYARAQINGVPASVTSPGFGGRGINGTPPSVSSLGPRGFAPRGGGQFQSFSRHDHDGDHHRGSQFVYPFYYPYYGSVYGAPDSYAMDSGQDSESDSDYQGGPTIFDRRGRGAEDYVPPVKDTAPAQSSQTPSSEPPAPETPQVPTVLVFKDGHQSEVENYAIFGQTLFDLTPGHRRKIALADLNLVATEKQNDDRGVSFQLPPGTQAN
jgi:hypothetical protein